MTEDILSNIRKLHEEDERFFLSIRTEKASHAFSGDTRIQAHEWSLDAHDHRGVLLAEVDRLRRHVDALQAKVSAESCACGYDSPDAVCLAHSPQLMAAGVEIEKMRSLAHFLKGALDASNAYVETLLKERQQMHETGVVDKTLEIEALIVSMSMLHKRLRDQFLRADPNNLIEIAVDEIGEALRASPTYRATQTRLHVRKPSQDEEDV